MLTSDYRQKFLPKHVSVLLLSVSSLRVEILLNTSIHTNISSKDSITFFKQFLLPFQLLDSWEKKAFQLSVNKNGALSQYFNIVIISIFYFKTTALFLAVKESYPDFKRFLYLNMEFCVKIKVKCEHISICFFLQIQS